MADGSPCCGTGRQGRSMFSTGYVALDEFPVLGLSEYFSRTLDKCSVRKAVPLKLIHHPCRQVSDVSVDAISAQYLGDPEVPRELTASTSPPRCGEQRGPHCGSRASFRCCLGQRSEGTLAAVRMEIAPPRPVAIPEAEAPMAPSLVKSAVEPAEPAATSPRRCRGRSESGRAESGGRNESDADLTKHDDLLWFLRMCFLLHPSIC